MYFTIVCFFLQSQKKFPIHTRIPIRTPTPTPTPTPTSSYVEWCRDRVASKKGSFKNINAEERILFAKRKHSDDSSLKDANDSAHRLKIQASGEEIAKSLKPAE